MEPMKEGPPTKDLLSKGTTNCGEEKEDGNFLICCWFCVSVIDAAWFIFLDFIFLNLIFLIDLSFL